MTKKKSSPKAKATKVAKSVKVAAKAEKGCPVSKVLKAEISLDATLL